MTKKIRKHRCAKCNNMATWFYMPGRYGYVYFCDDCVPRGCSCNVNNVNKFQPTTGNIIWWDKEEYEASVIDPNRHRTPHKVKQPNDAYWEEVDDKWRRYPCCEYSYCEDGYEIEEFVYYIKCSLARLLLERSKLRGTNTCGQDANKSARYHEMISEIESVITSYTEIQIPCNVLMHQVRKIFEKYSRPFSLIKNEAFNFYNSFRDGVNRAKQSDISPLRIPYNAVESTVSNNINNGKKEED